MTLQRKETIPGPVSCYGPSWTICWPFCSWWLPFEPCGGYLEAQPCEVTSKEATFCLLEVTRKEGGILPCLDSALTWQMLGNELGNKGRMWIFQICMVYFFSFLDMHHSLSLTEIAFWGLYSWRLFITNAWLAKFHAIPGSETDVEITPRAQRNRFVYFSH